MARIKQRLVRGGVMAAMLALLVGLWATPAFAAEYNFNYLASVKGSLKQVSNGKTLTLYLNPRTGTENGRQTGVVYYWHGKSGFTKVKSSKRSVAIAGNEWNYIGQAANTKQSGTDLWLMPRKVGKTTLTYTYKGKVRKVNVVVKKWESPIKKLVVGGKVVKASKKGSLYVYKFGNKKIDGKRIKITSKPGWAIKGIYEVDDCGYSTTKIKNGSKIKAYYNHVRIVMKNKKTGATEDVLLKGAYVAQ